MQVQHAGRATRDPHPPASTSWHISCHQVHHLHSRPSSPWTRWRQQCTFPHRAGQLCKGHIRSRLSKNVQGLLESACKPQRRIRAKSWGHQPERQEWHPAVEMLVRRLSKKQQRRERGPREEGLSGHAEDDGIDGNGRANTDHLSASATGSPICFGMMALPAGFPAQESAGKSQKLALPVPRQPGLAHASPGGQCLPSWSCTQQRASIGHRSHMARIRSLLHQLRTCGSDKTELCCCIKPSGPMDSSPLAATAPCVCSR